MEINLPMNPPVNNNIQGNLYDKLDAISFEKIRVANHQLDTRLSIQEKIINKYRKDAEKIHAVQSRKLRQEVRKINTKRPDYVQDDSEIGLVKHRAKIAPIGRQRSLSESSDCSYCRRYYSHHYQVKDTTKVIPKEKEFKKDERHDFFNLRWKMMFLNSMNRIYQRNTTNLEHDLSESFNSGIGMNKQNSEKDADVDINVENKHDEDDVFENNYLKSMTDFDCDSKSDKFDESTARVVDPEQKDDDHKTKCDIRSPEIDVTRQNQNGGHRRRKRTQLISKSSVMSMKSCKDEPISESDFEIKKEEWRRASLSNSKHSFGKIYVGLLQ